MMRNRLSPSRGRADLRARWAEHLAAQRKSGQTQGTYCRAQGLDPKYFTPWKGKLQSIAVASASRMVPAVVVLSAQPTVSAMPETVREAGFGWRRGPGERRCFSLCGNRSASPMGSAQRRSGSRHSDGCYGPRRQWDCRRRGTHNTGRSLSTSSKSPQRRQTGA